MTKEQFVNFMEKFEVRRHDYQEWIDRVEDVFRGAWESITEHSYEGFLLDTIMKILNDKNEWLTYYIYERDCEFFTYQDENGNECSVDSLEDLYDLIKEESNG